MSRKDLTAALGCAAVGALAAVLVFLRGGPVYFYQSYMPELVYSACGFGLVHPSQVPKAVADFLYLKSASLDCSALGVPAAFESRGVFVQLHLYLAAAVSWLWRISSIKYTNLWPLVALLAGTYVGAGYVLLRLFFGRWAACAGAMILALSPVTLSMLMFLRDFSKAPFIVGTVALLLLTTRAQSWQPLLLRASLAGAVAGAGYGFRSDPILLLPIGVMFLALGLRSGTWKMRAGAIGLYIAATLVLASPMLLAERQPGFGTVFMEGMSEPFSEELGLGPALYTIGQRYSDELVLSSVTADLRPADPEWDIHEGRISQTMTQAVTRSGSYVRSWIAFFAGDLTTQALKSAAWIVGFPALVAPRRVGLDPSGWGPSTVMFARLLKPVYDVLGQSWMPTLCAVGFVAFFWRATADSPREAVALLVMFAALLCYPLVQFAVRHVFHLEFFWIISLLALLHLPSNWGRLRRVAVPFWSACAFVFLVVIGIRSAFIAYQDRALREHFALLLEQPREPVVVLQRSEVGGESVFGVPLPERYRSLAEGRPDSMTKNSVWEGVQWEVRAAADRLLLTLSGRGCRPGKFDLSIRYAKRDDVWQPFDNTIAVEIPKQSSENTFLLVPAFYRPSQYFSEIRVPNDRATCLAKVERIMGSTRLPIILTAVLSSGWQDVPLHRAFGGFPVGPQ